MNREDIIRMAREAGLLPHPENIVYQDPMFEGRIKTFAALVAAAEREACAKVCDEVGERRLHSMHKHTSSECAAAIRARGQE
jgi:hypothetical protein